MNRDALTLNIVVTADEATLQDIYCTFVSHPALFDKLATLCKHTLEGAVLARDFEVEVQHNLQIEHCAEPAV